MWYERDCLMWNERVNTFIYESLTWFNIHVLDTSSGILWSDNDYVPSGKPIKNYSSNENNTNFAPYSYIARIKETHVQICLNFLFLFSFSV